MIYMIVSRKCTKHFFFKICCQANIDKHKKYTFTMAADAKGNATWLT